jgi:hypothetical protein
VLQTLPVFFFVGGYGSAKGLRRPYRQWIRLRLLRLFRPVMVLLCAWAVIALVLTATGPSPAPLVKLALSPLWFLCVYAGLTALTPLLCRLEPRPATMAVAVAVPIVVVAVADLARLSLGGPAWLGRLNVPAGWLVPYLLGIAWAKGALRSRRAAVILLTAGVGGTAALVAWAGYPAAMVGVPGAPVSNLDPPTLAAVTFGLAQIGLALLVRERLVRRMRKPIAWAAVALANLSAMTVFCWHQSAFMLVTLVTLGVDPVSGLHDAPRHPAWVVHRLAWLPVFALTLTVLWAVFHRYERGRHESRPGPRPGRRHEHGGFTGR